jgi:anti-sigma factor ChrR (cupin superfamily)
MQHPGQFELALYAASDLGAWRNFVVGRHVRRCPACAHEVEVFRATREFLDEAADQMPGNVNWSRMSAEIHANIKLGIEAGQIAGPASDGYEAPARPMGWRIAAAAASLTVLTISGVWLHLPRPLRVDGGAAEPRVVLKSVRSGIELAENGRSLALMHRASDRVTVTVGMQGELRARYVDDETGEVTIHNVYSE